MPLTPLEERLRESIVARQGEYLAFLEKLVRVNSGSGNVAGIEAVGEMVKPAFEALGFSARWEQPAYGHNREKPARTLIAVRAAKKPAAKPVTIFLTAHLDTVFEPEAGFEGFQIEGDRAIGPGIVDCKGGVVAILAAMEALRDVTESVELKVVLNGDEETGSHESREIFEREAKGAAYALVFEGGRPSGDIVAYRAGNGGYDLKAVGRAAHAGNAHQDGVNAIEALAHAIAEVQKLTDYAKGVTVNVGTIRGGTKRNIVPGEAHCQIDVRFARAEDGAPLDAAIRAIAARETVRGASIDVAGGLNRPPWPKDSPAIATLADRWIAAAKDFGVTCKAGPTGGGSDGNWTAAMGIPTLDGLGPVGGKYHTIGEYLVLPTLPERAAIAAIAIHRLAGGGE